MSTEAKLLCVFLVWLAGQLLMNWWLGRRLQQFREVAATLDKAPNDRGTVRGTVVDGSRFEAMFLLSPPIPEDDDDVEGHPV